MNKLATVLILPLLLATSAPGAEVAGFYDTLAEARKAAKAQDKPMYVHFTRIGCGWCRQIEKDIYGSVKGTAALRDFVPVSLDCTVPRGQKPAGEAKINLDLMRKLGGGGYPFLVMMTLDGAVLNTIGGYVPVATFVEKLEQAKKVHQELKAFQAAASEAGNKDNYQHHLQGMLIYEKVRLLDKAAQAAKAIRRLDRDNKKGHAAQASWTLLLQAQAEKAGKAKIDALVADIRKHDPANQKGMLERVLFGQAMGILRAAGRQPGPTRAKHVRKAVAKLTELTAMPNLTRAQNAWGYLANAHMMLGERGKAIAAFEKAYQADPTSRLAPQIKQIIARLKAGPGK